MRPRCSPRRSRCSSPARCRRGCAARAPTHERASRSLAASRGGAGALSAELHDRVGPALAGLKMSVAARRRGEPRVKPEVTGAQLARQATETADELRHVLAGLGPAAIAGRGPARGDRAARRAGSRPKAGPRSPSARRPTSATAPARPRGHGLRDRRRGAHATSSATPARRTPRSRSARRARHQRRRRRPARAIGSRASGWRRCAAAPAASCASAARPAAGRASKRAISRLTRDEAPLAPGRGPREGLASSPTPKELLDAALQTTAVAVTLPRRRGPDAGLQLGARLVRVRRHPRPRARRAASSERNSRAERCAVAECPAGKRVVGAGAAISGGVGEVVIDGIVPTSDLRARRGRPPARTRTAPTRDWR